MIQIVELCQLKEDVKKKVHSIIDKFAERGLRSLAVSRQVSDGSSSLFIESMIELFSEVFICQLIGSSGKDQGESRSAMAVCGSLTTL